MGSERRERNVAMPFATNFVGGLLQEKPDLPDFKPINVQREQRKAIEGNIDAFPQIRTLGDQVTSSQVEQLKRGIESLLPGFGNITEEASQRLQEGLRGELGDDVENLIARRAAERGIATGTGGSQFADFGELRTLGLTAMDRIQTSLNTALQWINVASSRVPIFDPSGS